MYLSHQSTIVLVIFRVHWSHLILIILFQNIGHSESIAGRIEEILQASKFYRQPKNSEV